MSGRAEIMNPSDRIGLSRAEAAAYIGISPPTWDRLVGNGSMPRPKKIFSRLVWDRREIDIAFAHLGSGDTAPAEDEDEYAV